MQPFNRTTTALPDTESPSPVKLLVYYLPQQNTLQDVASIIAQPFMVVNTRKRILFRRICTLLLCCHTDYMIHYGSMPRHSLVLAPLSGPPNFYSFIFTVWRALILQIYLSGRFGSMSRLLAHPQYVHCVIPRLKVR